MFFNESYKDDKYIKKLMQDYVNVSRKPMMGSVFITQDGTFINMGDNADDSHGDIIGILENEDVTMYDDIWDFSQDYGFVRGNSGLHLDGNAYIELLEDKPSYDQYDAIENWLYFIMNHGVNSIEVYITDNGDSITYSFDEYFPEDIIKKIKKAYTVGQLSESWQIAQIDDSELDDVTADVFVSDDVRDIIREINRNNRWEYYKFILDEYADKYIMLDPFVIIHDDALYTVMDNYWYPNMTGKDAFNYMRQHIDKDMFYIMVTFGTTTDGLPNDLGQDYFNYAYMYPNFNVLTRSTSFTNTELYKLLGKEDKFMDVSKYSGIQEKLCEHTIKNTIWVDDSIQLVQIDENYYSIQSQQGQQFGELSINHTDKYLNSIYISESGKGIGTKVMSYLVDNDIVRELDVDLQNTGAQRLYRKVGFKPKAIVWGNVDGDGNDRYIMTTENVDSVVMYYQDSLSDDYKDYTIICTKLTNGKITFSDDQSLWNELAELNITKENVVEDLNKMLSNKFIYESLLNRHLFEQDDLVGKNRTKLEKDSEGNTLSEEQLQYFRNTKVRDDKGNLLVCYHSTNSSFNSFNSKKSWDYFGFHFGTKKSAEYIGGRRMIKAYLNITNPLIVDEDFQYWDAFSFIRYFYTHPEVAKDFDIEDWDFIREQFGEDMKEFGPEYIDTSYYCTEFGDNIRKALYNSKYDGIFYPNWGEDVGSISYMCFYPEQIKYIDNKQPTRSKKMNESQNLSKQQEDFFKDSKIRRRNGELIICTHCSDEEFQTFDVDRIGSGSGGVNGYGFYFTAHETNDNGYGKNAYKCYLNITNPFIFTDDPNEIIELCEQCGHQLDQKDIDFALSEFDKYEDDYQTAIDDLLNGNVRLFTKMIKDCGYDGIWATPYEEVIAFYPNQIKRITNENPTNSNNINEATLYRGEGEYNHSTTHKKNYGGLFFATNEGDASEYSDNVVKYVIDDNAKIYNGRSSETYCEQNNLFDVEDKDILELTNGSISKISQMYDDGQFIDDDYLELCFPIWQLMARKDLEKKGYDGAHWKWEDDLTPEQYQIWNTSVVSKQIGEQINEEFDMSNYLSNEYKVFQSNVQKIIDHKFKVVNKELDRFGFETIYIDDYDFDINEDEWIGVFYNEIQDNASVFPIAINIPFLYKEVISGELDKDDLPYHIEKTIWHEVGHGLFAYLNDVFELDDLDEEQVVEEYACYQMGELNDSELIGILNSYVLEFGSSSNDDSVNEDYGDDEMEDEDSIYAHFDEQCGQFNDAFYTLTPEEFINLVGGDKVLMDTIDENAPMYILPNGKILSVKRLFKHNGIDQTLYHANFVFPLIKNYFKDIGYSDEEIDDILCEVDECVTDIDVSDLMFHATYGWGWARCNCGRTWGESRFYCVLPNTLTTSQIYTLWDWLDWGVKNKQKNVLIFAKDTEQHTIYSLIENSSDDIIKKIKRFYSSSRFYESINESDDGSNNIGYDFWYHGTTHKQLIKEFNQYVNWFSTNRRYAEEYAYAPGSILYKCKLFNTNPIKCGETSKRVYSKFVNPRDYEYSTYFMNIMNQLGLGKDEIDGLVSKVIEEQAAVGDVAYQRALLIDVVTRTRIFASMCIAKGFDSILAKEYGSQTCGVFDPKNIKILGYKRF